VRLGKAPADPIEQQLIKEKEERIKAETEARYAKAERDRLKKQIYALTEAKTQAERAREEEAARQALKEARDQEAREAKAARPKPEETANMAQDFTAAVGDYNDRVRKGIGLAEKKRILERINARFRNAKVDLSTVQRELRSLAADEEKMRNDFDLSMGFYHRLAEQGSNVDERRGMLQRIIEKYRESGIDVSAAEAELRALDKK
jgi:hypothetical protein